MHIKIKKIEGGKLPEFKHKDDACADCHARLDSIVSVKPGERALIPLGFALGLDPSWEAVVRPRSGLTAKGIDNGIGTIDAGYRGEVKACLINNSGRPFTVSNGDRICQIAFRENPVIAFEEVETLNETERGTNGFGSTGIN